MSNEEFYDNDVESIDEVAVEDNADVDSFEVELHRRSPKGDVFLQIYPRTRYWLREAVRPEMIIREDKENQFFDFAKKMKTPEQLAPNATRYIQFRCNISLSELEIEMNFSYVAVVFENADGTLSQAEPILENTPEAEEAKAMFEKVINHLAAYLSKS